MEEARKQADHINTIMPQARQMRIKEAQMAIESVRQTKSMGKTFPPSVLCISILIFYLLFWIDPAKASRWNHFAESVQYKLCFEFHEDLTRPLENIS